MRRCCDPVAALLRRCCSAPLQESAQEPLRIAMLQRYGGTVAAPWRRYCSAMAVLLQRYGGAIAALLQSHLGLVAAADGSAYLRANRQGTGYVDTYRLGNTPVGYCRAIAVLLQHCAIAVLLQHCGIAVLLQRCGGRARAEVASHCGGGSAAGFLTPSPRCCGAVAVLLRRD